MEGAAEIIPFREKQNIFCIIFVKELCKIDKMLVWLPFLFQDRIIREKISELSQISAARKSIFCFQPGKPDFCGFNINRRRSTNVCTEDGSLLKMFYMGDFVFTVSGIIFEIIRIPFQITFLFLQNFNLILQFFCLFGKIICNCFNGTAGKQFPYF